MSEDVCQHRHTRPFSADDQSPYCVSCLSIVVQTSRR